MPSKPVPQRAAALSLRSLAVLLVDFTVVFLSYTAATFLILPVQAAMYLSFEGGFERVVLAGAVIVILMYFHGLYPQPRMASGVKLALDLINVFGVALVAQACLVYAGVGLELPTRVMLAGSVLALTGLLCCRITLAWRFAAEERILIAGITRITLEITKWLAQHRELGLRVVGFVDDDPAAKASAGKAFAPLSELLKIAKTEKPDRVLLALPPALPPADIAALRKLGIRVQHASSLYETLFGRVDISSHRSLTVPESDPLQSRPLALAVQSIYTNLLALAAVLASLPVLLIVAAAIRCSSRGPAFLFEECAGLDGIPFQRTRFSCYRQHRNEDGSISRFPTPIGRFLMRYRLQGLPQCLNVLRGEMSLVGPEPERIEFSNALAKRIPAWSQRFTVKPGIIGWSALNLNEEEYPDTVRRLEYDLYYAKHVSPVLDAAILLDWAKGVVRRPWGAGNP